VSGAIVVGGGAVGLCVAEALASRGEIVTVLERDRCGSGASAGNAGWVTPSLSIPVPGPGVITQSLRWLVDRSGPLWIRPTLSPAMLAWVTRFAGSCSRPAFRRGLAALQAAAGPAGAAFDRLLERGVSFEMHHHSLLYPAFERAELEHLLEVADQLRVAGAQAPVERVGSAELVALEPALDQRVLGGLIADGERRVRPERFVSALRQALVRRGVEVCERARVDALARDGGGWLLRGGERVHRADAVLLAAGVETVRLLDTLEVRLPVVAAKGYSRTYSRDPSGPQRPVYLEQPKVAISVFDGNTRVSGTLELGARDLALSRRRLNAITAAAQRAMPGWQMSAQPMDWAGLRSLSPDGLPFIGGVPGRPGLYVATGHGTLGITLAPLGGELLAELILEGNRAPLLQAFDPARAGARKHPLQRAQEDSR
jgi:D-amino-acid dehydrogenase